MELFYFLRFPTGSVPYPPFSLSFCRSLNRVRRVLCAVKGGREDGCADGHPALAWGREGSRGGIHRSCEKGTFRRRRNMYEQFGNFLASQIDLVIW